MLKEPVRNTSIESLEPTTRQAVAAVIAELRSAGYDPVVFEARRTPERQRWLYGVGRTHSRWRKPVTWTLKSKHLEGRAADVISKSRLWNWPEFYAALARTAKKHGLKTLTKERCHIER